MNDHVLIDARQGFELIKEHFVDAMDEGAFAYLDRVAYCDCPYLPGTIHETGWKAGYQMMTGAVRAVAQ